MALQRAATLTLCFDRKSSLFCFSERKIVNQLEVSGIAVLTPPDSVSGNNAAAGRNYHFVASVLGSLKYGPCNPHTGPLAIQRVTCDGRHDSVLVCAH